MIKFFHIADTHFGVENYGKSDVSTGIHTRLLDFDAALGFCVDSAIKEDIDCLLFCGDAYKTANPTPTQQRLFAKQMLRLQVAGIPVVIVVGNHDHPLSFGKAHSLDVFSYLPVDGFYVISKPEILKLKTKSGDLQIVGIPWPTRNNLIANEAYRFKSNAEITAFLSERVGQIISSFAQSLDPNLPSILAAHLTVSNGIFSGSEKCAIFGNDPIFLPSQLAIQPFDYVALGHLHRYQNLNQGGIPVVYSGSIERIDFGERKENKGFCRVEIEAACGQKSCTHVFVEVPTRRMLQVEVVLEDGKEFTQQVVEEVKKSDVTDAIIKILYHLPEGKVDKIDLLEVMRACDKAYCIASITPIFKIAARERRAGVSVDMDFDLLLDKYFDSKKIDGTRKANLLKKAQELQGQFEVGNEI
jgi:exonuclease SbcD